MRVLNSLQVLRALAAILVAYAHAHDLAGDLHAYGAYQTGFLYLERFGDVGVDIFFVLHRASIERAMQLLRLRRPPPSAGRHKRRGSPLTPPPCDFWLGRRPTVQDRD